MPGCDEAPFKANFEHEAWWDPTWFPGINPEVSFAVFTFDTRIFGESDPEYTSNPDWGLDALGLSRQLPNWTGSDHLP